eukprot:jgi/Botrbrau1/8428/Bobra.0237s0047.1
MPGYLQRRLTTRASCVFMLLLRPTAFALQGFSRQIRPVNMLELHQHEAHMQREQQPTHSSRRTTYRLQTPVYGTNSAAAACKSQTTSALRTALDWLGMWTPCDRSSLETSDDVTEHSPAVPASLSRSRVPQVGRVPQMGRLPAQLVPQGRQQSQAHRVVDLRGPRALSRNLLEGRGRAEVHMAVHAGRDVPRVWTQDGPRLVEGRDVRESGVGPVVVEGPRGESRAEAIREWLDRQGSSPNKSLIRLNASINLSIPPDDPSNDDRKSCGEVLKIPRVAVLFLTRGELFHEPTWWLWFRHAASLIPTSALMRDAAACQASGGHGEGCHPDPEKVKLAKKLCSKSGGEGAIQNQFLFSVYIHSLPDFGEFPVHSIFHQREIQKRIHAQWGTHELAEAMRNLMQEALEDPLTERLILLSESGIPLYPPHVIYQQLMGEKLSRINACPSDKNEKDSRDRFTDKMGEEVDKAWRKSSQWIGLTRRHAEFVVKDTKIYPIFEEHCTSGFDEHLDRQRDCVSDEHYIPTLLAYLGVDNETDCLGCLVSTRWSGKKGKTNHPYSYRPSEITPSRIKSLRERPDWVGKDEPECDSASAIQSASAAFVSTKDLDRKGHHVLPMYDRPLPPYCTLFARKFPKESTNQVFNLLRSCRAGLNITQGDCTD